MGKKETLNNHNVNNNNVSNPFSPPSSGFAKLAAKGYRRPSFPDSFKGRISREKFNEYLDEFERLAGESLASTVPGEPVRLSGIEAKPALLASGLPQSTLAKIWALADFSRDGGLDAVEFAIASHFMDLCLERRKSNDGNVGDAEETTDFEEVLPKELGDLRPTTTSTR